LEPGATRGGAGDRRVRIETAMRVATRRIIRGDRERVARLTPIAMIVAGAGVLIEIAILPTRRIVLTRNTAKEGVFGVVARSRAVGIVRIIEAVSVVVDAVAALIDLPLAHRFLATMAPATDAHTRRATRRIVTPESKRAGGAADRASDAGRTSKGRQISSDLDALRARGSSDEGAHDGQKRKAARRNDVDQRITSAPRLR